MRVKYILFTTVIILASSCGRRGVVDDFGYHRYLERPVYEYHNVERVPFLKSDRVILYNVNENISDNWPDHLLSIRGYVLVSYVVGENGNVRSVQVESGLHNEIDSMVVEAVSGLENWRPGQRGGVRVPTRMYLRYPVELKEKTRNAD
jgi:hypothetical protein